MELDIMQFLLEVQSRLHESADPAHAEPLTDLQAVERVLPDTDWFECEEVRELDAPYAARRLEPEPEPRLEF